MTAAAVLAVSLTGPAWTAGLAAEGIGTGVSVGAGTLIALVFGYLFKELRRKDDSVWRLMAEKDKENKRLRAELDAERTIRLRLTVERDFWRGHRLEEGEAAYEAVERALERHDRDQARQQQEGERGEGG